MSGSGSWVNLTQRKAFGERKDEALRRLRALQGSRGATMPSYSPELIRIMRAALNEVMTKIPYGTSNAGC